MKPFKLRHFKRKKMDRVLDSINKLIIKYEGGILALWGAIIYGIIKLFQFLGGCMAEGAINKGMAKIIPIVKTGFKIEFDRLEEEIKSIKTEILLYKSEKHKIQNENSALKEVFSSDDSKLTREIRNLIKNEKK